MVSMGFQLPMNLGYSQQEAKAGALGVGVANGSRPPDVQLEGLM